MKKIFALACMAAFALAGCQEEQFEEKIKSTKYFASVESFDPSTRTAIGEGRTIVWSDQEYIAVFEGNDNLREYLLDSDKYIGENYGEFFYTDEIQGTGIELNGTIAVYPFKENLTVAPGAEDTYIINGVSFPSMQYYAEASFDNGGVFPMVGLSPYESEEDYCRNISFKNIGGVIKLSLTGDHPIGRIYLSGNSGEPLSGSATVTIGSDGIPSVTMSEDASTFVNLFCDPPVQLDPEVPTDFYISIPPTEFQSGFTVVASPGLTGSLGQTYIRRTDKTNSILRSSILTMPATSLEKLDMEPTPGQWVDLGLNVLWAGWNVGANSPEEAGGYYALGETEEKESYSEETYEHREWIEDEYGGGYWDSFNFYHNVNISGTSYDVAHVKWGDGARMPTGEEGYELFMNCCYQDGVYKNKNGVLVTGPNGNSIFFPYAGIKEYNDDDLSDAMGGAFWLGSVYYLDEIDWRLNAHLILFEKEEYSVFSPMKADGTIHIGLSVRPVKDK